jgi:hypothetical protein
MSIQHMTFVSIVVGVVFLSIAAVAIILYVKQVRGLSDHSNTHQKFSIHFRALF